MNTTVINGGICHKSLVQTIAEEIEKQIINFELKPGERLVEQTMCERFQVSRSPLREAFRILEHDGFLTNTARRGACVSGMTYKEAVDIYTIRANLESLAAGLAVKNDDGTLAQRLRARYETMKAAAARNDVNAYAEANSAFHAELIAASGNERLISMLDLFVKQTARYRALVIQNEGRLETSLRKHEELILAVERGNAAEVEEQRKNAILANIDLMREIFTTSK
ncbi:MAG: GntR family transcriptional regulator [Pyramidobacter sp.]|nr:GntR family transcriptional regulator [Pyramidobacter sp.]